MQIKFIVPCAAVVFAAMVWVVGADPVHAAPPAKATDITGPKLVFVTTAEVDGNLGGLDGADATCQLAADGAGLSGDFQAWLSDSTGTPTTRFTTLSLGPYFLLNGGIVAENFADLVFGPIRRPIAITETGALAGGTDLVWTSTANTGVHAIIDCDDWLSASAGLVSRVGSRSATLFWSSTNNQACNVPAHLYCFEQ